MPSVVRLGDYCSGHQCFPPRQNNRGSGNVFINSLPCHRKDDTWIKHRCGDNSHTGILASGSKSVFVNSLDIARVGDPVDCGSACIQGSPNVFSG
jgi:uncharacterized Zn-binding protein involved in type VI secretion